VNLLRSRFDLRRALNAKCIRFACRNGEQGSDGNHEHSNNDDENDQGYSPSTIREQIQH
jgi:hypothetical protein